MDVVPIILKSAILLLRPMSAIEMSSPSMDVPVMRPAVRITFLVLRFLVIAILSKGLYNPEIIYLVSKFTILIIQISVKILIFLFLTLLIMRCM
jgi:hypothetical protein